MVSKEERKIKVEIANTINRLERECYITRETIIRILLKDKKLRRTAIKLLGRYYKEEVKDTLELYEGTYLPKAEVEAARLKI